MTIRTFRAVLMVTVEDTEETGLSDDEVEYRIQTRLQVIKESLSVHLREGMPRYGNSAYDRYPVKVDVTSELKLHKVKKGKKK